MASHLFMSGDAWEVQMIAEAAARENSGLQPDRQYRVCIAASHDLEDRCMQQVVLLFKEPQLWSLVPPNALTAQTRCQVFRMLSRIACTVEELLREVHRAFPYAVFLLLVRPDAATVDELMKVPECMRDTFTTRFLNMYPDPLQKEALAVLEAVAAHLKVDIGQIECRHASIRRQLQARFHTHTMSFDQLSGHFMSQQVRTQAAAAAKVVGRKRKLDGPGGIAPGGEARPHRKRKAKRGGGGGQRAYLSEQLRTRRLRLNQPGVAAQLNEEYRNLPAERLAVYMDRGQRATARWQKSSSRKLTSMGLWRRRREAVAAAEAKMRVNLHSRLANLALEDRLERLAELSVSRGVGNSAYLSTVTKARQHSRAMNAASKMTEKARHDAVTSWREREGGAAARELVAALGVPPGRAGAVADRMVAEPSNFSTIVKCLPDIGKVAEELAAELHSSQQYHQVREAMHEDSCFSTAKLIGDGWGCSS